jgi:hypothetical protein
MDWQAGVRWQARPSALVLPAKPGFWLVGISIKNFYSKCIFDGKFRILHRVCRKCVRKPLNPQASPRVLPDMLLRHKELLSKIVAKEFCNRADIFLD